MNVNKKCYCILVIMLIMIIGFNSANAQMKKTYSVSGTYKGKTAQGMAIHKNISFLLNDGGHCRLYDLKKKKIISDFDLASAGKGNHANCASFGINYPKGNNKYPAFYVSECGGDNRCFVENITEEGSKLIQTIVVKTEGREKNSLNWFIDKEQQCIYTIARPSNEIDSLGTKKYLITKFSLPPLDSANVVFVDKDIIEQFEIRFPNLLQGGVINGNYLYLPVGLHESIKFKDRKNKERAVIIVNLKTKLIQRTINLENNIRKEPEDADFYKGDLLLYCGQEGGLYKISKNNFK